jgi:hypothetical protein
MVDFKRVQTSIAHSSFQILLKALLAWTTMQECSRQNHKLSLLWKCTVRPLLHCMRRFIFYDQNSHPYPPMRRKPGFGDLRRSNSPTDFLQIEHPDNMSAT